MTYIKINDTEYRAAIRGTLTDRAWDNRDSKTITLEMAHADALALFVNDTPWSIIMRSEGEREQTDEEGNLVLDENNNPIMESYTEEEVYDNSEYCVAGAITDNRNGTVSVKMGQKTAEEMLAELKEALNND